MHNKFEQQISLGETPISEVKIKVKRKHRINTTQNITQTNKSMKKERNSDSGIKYRF